MQFRNAQRGQAMAEYMTLVPAAIMIMIGASLVAGFVVNSLNKTIEVFSPVGMVCEAEEKPAAHEGPTVATLGNHTVELTASVYNPADDTTTITYRVTSGPKPSISHWVLALPDFVYDNLLESSEGNYSWGTDPTTGVTGIKYDTGYEVEGGGNNGGGNGNGKGNGGKKSKVIVLIEYPTYAKFSSDDAINTVSREITLLISGQYNWGPLDVTVKAGQNVHYSTISAPITYYDPSLNQGCE